MHTRNVVADEAPVGIPVDDCEAASRYIAAIVGRDPRASADARFAAWRARQLWDQFGAAYEAAASGPYARHGVAALRIALDSL